MFLFVTQAFRLLLYEYVFLVCNLGQWHTQKIFIGVFHSVAHGGQLYLVCAVCDVTIGRHIHVFKPRFWRSLLP